MAAAAENPVVNAMLLCEHVHRDSLSGKHTLLGVFDEIQLSAYPGKLDAFGIYVNLTNMRGSYAIDLRWLRGDTEEELARLGPRERGAVQDPLARVELLALGTDLPLPGPGRYVLRLLVNGRHLQDLVTMASEVRE